MPLRSASGVPAASSRRTVGPPSASAPAQSISRDSMTTAPWTRNTSAKSVSSRSRTRPGMRAQLEGPPRRGSARVGEGAGAEGT
eukprot:2265272-Pyramimonas_sp.AAC.2